MDNLNNKFLHTQRATAPEGMYEQVRERLIRERIRAARTHRQLAIGSALLFIVGGLNVGLILFGNKAPKRPISKENTEQMLYKTYFDNAVNFSDEK
jgi:hypothetical protein